MQHDTAAAPPATKNVVENAGTVTITGWTFLFPMDDGVEVTEFWNAVLISPSGIVSARDQEHNSTLEPGQRVGFGFAARGTQSGVPASFTVNTVVCSTVD
ncbi:cellulose binding domain-containing protein [Phytohabitans houttuyneae]|uniref:cellulose binding domain-containing protein n=1 Tax=Phytohabitans houttuyneae TaxID=1076126 RepID=UPI0015656AE9|nr:cellulose binding domain-containing protein [Phytohabitans houttuyneae]